MRIVARRKAIRSNLQSLAAFGAEHPVVVGNGEVSMTLVAEPDIRRVAVVVFVAVVVGPSTYDHGITVKILITTVALQVVAAVTVLVVVNRGAGLLGVSVMAPRVAPDPTVV